LACAQIEGSARLSEADGGYATERPSDRSPEPRHRSAPGLERRPAEEPCAHRVKNGDAGSRDP
jgi:hypothetical protein